jgi:small subunit ribosomal protein S17
MAEEAEKVEGASASAEEVVADGAPADAEAPSEERTADAEEAAEAVEAAKKAEADDAPVETVVPDEGASADAEAPGDAPNDAASASAPAEARQKKRLPRSERRQRSKKPRVKPSERKPIVRLEKPEHERGRRQERQGTVVSDAMEKTIVVEVHMVKAHPKYKKVVRRSTKFHAHDEANQAKVGDVVRIVETRPLSKQKHWRLAEVLEVAK